jgi:hypothetical protein
MSLRQGIFPKPDEEVLHSRGVNCYPCRCCAGRCALYRATHFAVGKPLSTCKSKCLSTFLVRTYCQSHFQPSAQITSKPLFLPVDHFSSLSFLFFVPLILYQSDSSHQRPGNACEYIWTPKEQCRSGSLGIVFVMMNVTSLVES